MTLPDFISVVPVERIDSPCVNVCRIGRDRRCEGCRRTVDEIARWTTLTAAERDRIMAELPIGMKRVGRADSTRPRRTSSRRR